MSGAASVVTQEPDAYAFSIVGPGTYVCPTAGLEGGQPGFDPYAPQQEVIIEPELFGHSRIWRPQQASKEAILRATSAAYTSSQSLEDRREKASEVMYNLSQDRRELPKEAAQQHSMGAPMPAQPAPVPQAPPVWGQPMPVPPEYQPQPQVNYPVAPQVSPFGMPAPQFGAPLPGVQSQQQPAMRAPVGSLFNRPGVATPTLPPQHNQQVVTQAAQQPTVRVDFELEGVPMPMQGYFHKAVVQGPTLLLAFDSRLQNFPRQFPPQVEQRIAMVLSTDPSRTFQVVATGHRFQFENYEMAIYLIVG